MDTSCELFRVDELLGAVETARSLQVYSLVTTQDFVWLGIRVCFSVLTGLTPSMLGEHFAHLDSREKPSSFWLVSSQDQPPGQTGSWSPQRMDLSLYPSLRCLHACPFSSNLAREQQLPA